MSVSFHNIPRVSVDLLHRNSTSNLIISDTLKTTLQEKYWSVVFVDGKDHTSNIKLIDSSELQDNFQLLYPWTDGCIIYNLWDKQISLAVPLADCGGIWFSNKIWSLIGIVHAWHLWTSRDIVWEIFSKLGHREEIKNLSFYLAPMVGKWYEFSISDYEKNFWKIMLKYWFDASKYFKTINEKKWHLNLKQIIVDILLYHWVKKENIQDADIETNNPDLWYASHRMYTITWWDKRFEGRNLLIVSKK